MAEPQIQRDKNPEQTRNLSGKSVGRFVIRERLGAGGMGEVYRAEDTKLKRTVALKRIAPDLRAEPRYRQRFLREAELASRLSDPHIASIYDVLEEGDETFLVMEYVEGQTLRQRFRQPMSIDEFLPIATQCAAALVVAHERGILHRDIKPENIQLTRNGQVKVLDFGVAKRLPHPSRTTTLARELPGLSGTPSYMAPEALLEKELDERMDIFSLGVVFYEALSGRNPFLADGFLATAHRVLHETPLPLRALNPSVPAELERIVAKMLAKNPENRYRSAADLAVDLRAAERAVAAPLLLSVSPVETTAQAPKRKRLALLAAAGAVVAALLAVLAYRHFRSPVLTEHDWLLVTDFQNPSGEALFDDTVSESLRHSLQQSRYVQLVPRSLMVEAAHRMGRSDVTRIDASLGREICQRENYRALVTGQIEKAGSGYRIAVEVVDPWRGVTVLSEDASLRSTSNLYGAVDDLAKRLRAHWGESISQIAQHSQPLARVTTPSLEALQRYSRALDFYAAGDMESFLPLAQSAVQLDPDFAMAHLYLALAYERVGNEEKYRSELAQSRRGLDHVTERERYLILAADFEGQGQYEKAADQYRLLTELFPQDIEGYRGLANASVWAGRLDDATRAVQRAVQLNPHSAIDRLHLMLYLNRASRFSDALSAYRDAQAGGITSPQLHWGAGLAFLGQGNVSAARHEFELLRKEGGSYEENLSALFLARVLMYEGRLAEASEALRAGLVLGEKLQSGASAPVRRYLLAGVLQTRGRLDEARIQVQRLAAAGPDAGDEELREAGLLATELGEASTARALLGRLAAMHSQANTSSYTESCYYNLKGSVELAAGQPGAAVESEQRSLVYFPSYYAAAALGDAYAAQHNWPESIGAYQRYLESKGEIFSDDSPAAWVVGHLRLARALAQAGEKEKALRSYDEFLQLWAGADPDLPALRAARVEREQMVAGSMLESSRKGPSPRGH